jgi:hypothetical protein
VSGTNVPDGVLALSSNSFMRLAHSPYRCQAAFPAFAAFVAFVAFVTFVAFAAFPAFFCRCTTIARRAIPLTLPSPAGIVLKLDIKEEKR